MQRRRIERLGRLAIQVACWCEQTDEQSDIPMVFASRHGDVMRSMELLQALVEGEPLSPTAFGLSVHNAVAALYSIARQNRASYQSLAAGEATVEAALLEACALLAEGAPEVRVVVYDSQLPEVYATFRQQPDPYYAWCWRITAGDGTPQAWQLEWGQPEQLPAPMGGADLPHGLSLMQFLLANGPGSLALDDGPLRWRWTRYG